MSDLNEQLADTSKLVQGDQITHNLDGTVTVRILEDFEDPAIAHPGKTAKAYQLMREEEKAELTFRRVRVGDLLDADGLEGDRYYVFMISRLGDISERAVRRMGIPDYQACVLALLQLRQPVPTTGAKP